MFFKLSKKHFSDREDLILFIIVIFGFLVSAWSTYQEVRGRNK